MKELFSSLDSTDVQLRRAILEEEGIPTFVRNENLSQLTNAFAAPFQAALCVVNDDDYERAALLLRDLKNRVPGPDWACPQCKEMVPDSFDSCWNCQTTRSE